MLFDVKPILHTPGKQLDFQFALDLSDLEFGGRCPISRPVEVTGSVRNSADVLSLEMTARTTLDAVCDRCGKEFLQDKEIAYSCMLAEELQNEDNDEIVLLTDGEVDWAIWPGPLLSSEWTQKLCAPKTARGFAPGAVLI